MAAVPPPLLPSEGETCRWQLLCPTCPKGACGRGQGPHRGSSPSLERTEPRLGARETPQARSFGAWSPLFPEVPGRNRAPTAAWNRELGLPSHRRGIGARFPPREAAERSPGNGARVEGTSPVPELPHDRSPTLPLPPGRPCHPLRLHFPAAAAPKGQTPSLCPPPPADTRVCGCCCPRARSRPRPGCCSPRYGRGGSCGGSEWEALLQLGNPGGFGRIRVQVQYPWPWQGPWHRAFNPGLPERGGAGVSAGSSC